MIHDLIVILGPTASGKTKLATNLAFQIDSEIISADSRQVYRKMDIGTGKDLEEYVIKNKKIPFHLIDIVDAGEKFNVAEFQTYFNQVYIEIQSISAPILCGGTGLYVDAILKNYQNTSISVNLDLRNELESLTFEELLFKIQSIDNKIFNFDLSTKKRIIRAIEILNANHQNIEFKQSLIKNPIVFSLTMPSEIRQEKILKRLNFRLENGLIEEIQNLLNEGISAEDLIYYGLEYKFVTEFLQKKLNYSELQEKLFFAIRQYSKRQMTYFRSLERKGQKIHWLDAQNSIENNIEIIKSFL